MTQEIKSPSRIRRGQGGGERGDDLDDKLEDLKKRFHLLEGDKKAYFETTQWTLQSNKERIIAFRAENKQLYAQLTHLQRVVVAHLEGNNEVESMKYQLRDIRKKHDEIKSKVDEKTLQYNKLKDTLKGLAMETPNSEGSPQTSSLVRTLEQKIEKASLKHTEALTIKRTYEQILDHLQEDRIGYDSHVDSLESGVQSKDKELMELTNMFQDAVRSKEFAKEELAKCESIAAEEKMRRDQILDEKKQRIKQLADGNGRMDRKLKREEQRLADLRARAKPLTPTPERDADYYNQRLSTLATAYQRISSLAGAGNHLNDENILVLDGEGTLNKHTVLNYSSPDYDVIAQYLATQAEIARTLESHQNKASTRLETLKNECASLAETVQNVRLRQLVPPGTRKQVDGYEGRLAQSNASYVRARLKYERAAKANSAILAGVSSLASKLQFIEPEKEFATITDQNLAETLMLCKDKLNIIISATTKNRAHRHPQHNRNSSNNSTTSINNDATNNANNSNSITNSESSSSSSIIMPSSSSHSIHSIYPADEGALTPFPPPFTMRIKQNPTAQQSPVPEPPDPDESQVPTRESVKSQSAAMVERELKKTKRKQRKSSEGRDKRTPPPTSRNYSPSSTARTTSRGMTAPLSARPVKV